MNIIIVGAGKVGTALAEQLAEEENDLTVIDTDRSVLETCIEKYDVMGVEGNGASVETLMSAGIENCDLLISVAGQDEINLLCCMTAHNLNENIQTIARIRSPEYEVNLEKLYHSFRLSLSVNPEKATAVEIERLIRYPGFLNRDTFAKGRVELVEFKLPADSVLSDTEIHRISDKTDANILICAILRDGKATIPTGDFVLHGGDRVFITGAPEELGKFLRSLGIITKKSKKVLILGGGKISYYLASSLHKEGIFTQIIESDKDRCVHLAENLPGVCVVQGDASDREVLENEGIDTFDAVVSLTGIDELNIIVSIYADSIGVKQVITKLGRGENLKLLDSLPIGSIISPKEICSETITRYVRAMHKGAGAAAESVHSIADGSAEASEFILDENSKNCGKKLKDLKLKKNILIVSIARHGKIEIPNGESAFEVGDNVVVLSCGDTIINKFNDIFEN